jgi:hypothetical protein
VSDPSSDSDPVDPRHPSDRLGESAPVVAPELSTLAIVVTGTALWAVALVVTLVVPALHTGDRSWWPWTCVSGIGLGLFAGWYVRRGRGDALGT